MRFFAHSENDFGKKHFLHEHLKDTAELSEEFAPTNLSRHFKLAGLLHDLGKYQPEFQHYLENGGQRGSVPHAAWGAAYAKKLKQLEISVAIDGHHKGIPNRETWQNDTTEFIDGSIGNFQTIIDAFLKEMKNDIDSVVEHDKLDFPDTFVREAFIRYLFSVLTDADWIDTEKHFDLKRTDARPHKKLSIDTMIAQLDAAIAQKTKVGEINELRNKVLHEAISRSQKLPGFYSLNLPTGLGKTLISISWALRHARSNSLQRIIIVLPFINIIDQTAMILKELFGEDAVLEHHSAYNENSENGELAVDGIEKQKQLACENWDYPVIVTTSVQFFESLFSNKPSRCRKIHNIAKAVVIFDEVQSLPKEILLPTLKMLENVQYLMGTSFLFCTATMPAFEQREGFEGLKHIEPLIKDPEVIINRTQQRVMYHRLNELEPVEYPALVEKIRNEPHSVLCILNTKASAKDLYRIIDSDNSGWSDTFHLSTGMCPIHRKEVIKEIVSALKEKRKIFLVSTQLIEAGVDLDFPRVFREMAPLESIIQAAGRCNREGILPEKGNVFLFKLQGSKMPDQAYSSHAEFAIDLIKDNIDRLYEYSFFSEYYRKIISLFVDPDKNKINEARKKLAFETVNDTYHVIAKKTEALFVYRYDDTSEMLFETIRHKPFLSRDDYRKIQMYSVPVYKNFLIKQTRLCNDFPQGFIIWEGNYNKKTGISTELMSPDECIV